MDKIINAGTLFKPFDLRGLFLRNRVVMSPLTRSRAGEQRLPNSLMAEYYAQRASAGLIISEATVISKQGIGWLNSPGIYSDQQSHAWQQVVDAVHAKGAPMFLQFWHCGRASHSSFHPEEGLPVAPSAIAINQDYIHTPIGKQPYETPRALETDEVSAIVDDGPLNERRERDSMAWKYTRPMDTSLISSYSPRPIIERTAMAAASKIVSGFWRRFLERFLPTGHPVKWAFTFRRTAISTTWARRIFERPFSTLPSSLISTSLPIFT
jgi:hypothetical protein